MGNIMRKSLDEILEEVEKNPPKIHTYTIRQLAELTGEVWHSPRWHLEKLEMKNSPVV